MPSTFPTALDTFPNIGPTTREDEAGFEHDVVHQAVHDSLLAVQSTIGKADGSTPGSVTERLLAVESFADDAVAEFIAMDGRLDALESAPGSGAVARTITARFNGGATDGTPEPIEVGAEVILRAPYALTLTSWTLLLQGSTGAITVDVQTKPFSSGSFASITSTGTPSTTSGANADGTVTGWTTSISAGNLVRIVVTARTGDVFDAALQIEATQAWPHARTAP